MEKQSLKAVHDDELVEFMKALGIHSAFSRGELKCAFCKDVITWKNLHAFFPDSGAVKCCCAKSECIEKLVTLVVERKA